MGRFLKKIHVTLYLLFGLLCCSAFSSRVLAEESILLFGTELRILKTNKILVTETIRVVSEGDKIVHGIVRRMADTFYPTPTTGSPLRYKILFANRNGKPVDYFVQKQPQLYVFYFGEKEEKLPPGRYDFVIQYEVEGLTTFYPDRDEFVWNVTGTYWNIPIKMAVAIVILPDLVLPSSVKYTTFTGTPAERADDVKVVSGPKITNFFTTRQLSPFEGLFIKVAWPPGFIPRDQAN